MPRTAIPKEQRSAAALATALAGHRSAHRPPSSPRRRAAKGPEVAYAAALGFHRSATPWR